MVEKNIISRAKEMKKKKMTMRKRIIGGRRLRCMRDCTSATLTSVIVAVVVLGVCDGFLLFVFLKLSLSFYPSGGHFEAA